MKKTVMWVTELDGDYQLKFEGSLNVQFRNDRLCPELIVTLTEEEFVGYIATILVGVPNCIPAYRQFVAALNQRIAERSND